MCALLALVSVYAGEAVRRAARGSRACGARSERREDRGGRARRREATAGDRTRVAAGRVFVRVETESGQPWRSPPGALGLAGRRCGESMTHPGHTLDEDQRRARLGDRWLVQECVRLSFALLSGSVPSLLEKRATARWLLRARRLLEADKGTSEGRCSGRDLRSVSSESALALSESGPGRKRATPGAARAFVVVAFRSSTLRPPPTRHRKHRKRTRARSIRADSCPVRLWYRFALPSPPRSGVARRLLQSSQSVA